MKRDRAEFRLEGFVWGLIIGFFIGVTINLLA